MIFGNKGSPHKSQQVHVLTHKCCVGKITPDLNGKQSEQTKVFYDDSICKPN